MFQNSNQQFNNQGQGQNRGSQQTKRKYEFVYENKTDNGGTYYSATINVNGQLVNVRLYPNTKPTPTGKTVGKLYTTLLDEQGKSTGKRCSLVSSHPSSKEQFKQNQKQGGFNGGGPSGQAKVNQQLDQEVDVPFED